MLPARILWYNYILRHWHNLLWRLRGHKMRAGAISQEALDWAEQEINKIDWDDKGKPFDQFRREVETKRKVQP